MFGSSKVSINAGVCVAVCRMTQPFSPSAAHPQQLSRVRGVAFETGCSTCAARRRDVLYLACAALPALAFGWYILPSRHARRKGSSDTVSGLHHAFEALNAPHRMVKMQDQASKSGSILSILYTLEYPTISKAFTRV